MSSRLRLIRNTTLSALAATIAFWVYAHHRKTTTLLDVAYEQAERDIFLHLHMDRDELITSIVSQSQVSGEMQKALRMGIYTHHLLDYVPGQRVHFQGEHEYNIMAGGVERVEIDLRRISESHTQVTIDYFETTLLAGFLPITCRPGGWQELHLVRTIFGN